jgi:Amt family ammonium transporter
VPFILLGAGLLWFGWFGFNGASMFAAKTAGFPFLTTTFSASTALLTWCLIEWFRDGKPTAVGAATGAVAGLVGITPAAGFVYMPQAMLIGAATSACCYIAVQIKAAIRFDDSLDAYAVHGVGGTVGALLTGLLAVPALVPADYFPKAAQLLEQGGNSALFLAHLKVVLISYGFVGAGTAIILWVVGSVCGLRVSPEDEERGLDYVAHGEEAYDPMTY